MKIVEQYIAGLKKAYFDNNAKESWEHFERIIHGASKEDIGKLKDLQIKQLKYLLQIKHQRLERQCLQL